MKKKSRKSNLKNINQKSFFFEDYIETNNHYKKKTSSSISEDRIYILFFFFMSLIIIFAIKITFVSFQQPKFLGFYSKNNSFINLRRDIVDRNNEIISRSIRSYHAGVRSKLVKDKDKFVLKIKIIFPEIASDELKKKLNEKNFFYLKKRLTAEEKNKLWSLGEKSIIFEPFQSRIYPQAELFSHILGQIDDDNYGISGVEGFFDKELRNQKLINQPLKLTLDANIQYLIKTELDKSKEIFKANGAAGLLLDSINGEVLSLVSLPDYNINKRNEIFEKKYTNKITKSVFELGSVFKTFTIALALENELVNSKTLIKNIPNKVNCSKYTISDIKKFPKNLSVEDILIRSSNVGTLKIAQMIGEDKYKDFLESLNLLKTINFELDEMGYPLHINWDKCKLETVSYGHGIATTPLQVASAYSSLINGGTLVEPTLVSKETKKETKRVISEETSLKLNKILRKVVTDENGTASLADIFGYKVAGKTGTSQSYFNSDHNINTFISNFKINEKDYTLLVILENPQIAKDLIYDYRGLKIRGARNESGWNAVYLAGKIIEKIGPILAINNVDPKDIYAFK